MGWRWISPPQKGHRTSESIVGWNTPPPPPRQCLTDTHLWKQPVVILRTRVVTIRMFLLIGPIFT